jgi:hypothetical protein
MAGHSFDAEGFSKQIEIYINFVSLFKISVPFFRQRRPISGGMLGTLAQER